ncbi:staphylocoagulase [Staphylococcus sp. 30400_3112M30941]|nr:staphylocoagulase [Staphylococcus sp. 30403_3112M30944]MBO0945119.1 staphylocoagulase [Staphylococcus sp. 30402_3112M30943]MBO0963921.1 staphylocoagulase [Staphylococcus sp. 30400_3112M30941]MBO0965749.1 staphylocoagulase [Staphylococcus sp. 30401_3112M30942]
MKKQIISLGALAVASSLFTWDNKADAIVGKDYSKESRVNENSKYDKPISDWYLSSILNRLGDQIYYAKELTNKYEYGEKEYKKAIDKLMTRVLGEDHYLLEKKKAQYEVYKKWYEKYKSENPHSDLKKIKFDDFDLYRLTKKEYNEIHQSLKDAVEEFNSEVKDIQSKDKDLIPYDEETENRVTNSIYDFVCEIDTLYAAYFNHNQYGHNAKELRAKLDIILGDSKDPIRITNERIRKEMMDDLNSIIDDFFMDTNMNRPLKLTKFNPSIHDYTNKPENRNHFDALVTETREAVDKADDSWKTKTVKKYGESETKSSVVKEEKKVEDSQSPKVDNQQEVKTTVDKTEEATLPVAQPLVKIPGGTITGEIVKGPEYPTMEQSSPSLSDNYTQPSVTLPTITGESKVSNPVESTLKGIEGNSSKLEIKTQGTESTLKGIQGDSTKLEIKPQVTESTEATQYPARPQFNKTPKYVKYRDAGTGIREYNDGTFGYEARPRFNKPAETNAYNVTTHANGQVTYGARPTTKKPAETNVYNVTTHADGQVSYGARPTQNKPAETNAYNVTTHANGQVSYGARPTTKKPAETNAYNVTTHANGQVTYGARPTQNKPSKTNAYNVTTHANGQVTYGARPTYKKPTQTNAYNVTTHADGTATYGPRVTK